MGLYSLFARMTPAAFAIVAALFLVIPIVYVTRLAIRSRIRAPIVPICILGQQVLFAILFLHLNLLVAPRFLRIFASHNARLAPLTEWVCSLSIWLRNPAVLLGTVLVLGYLVRATGRWLKPRWDDRSYPASRIDFAGLLLWSALYAPLALTVLAFYLPILKMSVCVSGCR